MGQHYTRNTISTSAWCKKCQKNTPHKVTDRRLDYCIPCFENLDKRSKEKKQEPAAEQRGLFK